MKRKFCVCGLCFLLSLLCIACRNTDFKENNVKEDNRKAGRLTDKVGRSAFCCEGGSYL